MLGRTVHAILTVALVLTGADGSFAQVQQLPRQPLDPNVEDVNPLSSSFRDMQIDLREPVGFQNVFRVPGHDELMMRSSGALHAVFPQSQYARRRGGTVALVPAGTIFYIGEPPLPPLPDEEPEPRSNLVDLRLHVQKDDHVDDRLQRKLDNRIADGDEAPPPAGPSPIAPLRMVNRSELVQVGPTVANDEAYRVRRIAFLMNRAANEVRTAVSTGRENRPVTQPAGDEDHHRSSRGTSTHAPDR